MVEKELIKELFKRGCHFKLDVSMWTGRKKLNPVDLGIPEDEINDEIMNLGTKYLIPKEEIDTLLSLRNQADQFVQKNSYAFDFGGNFVPYEKLELVENEMMKIASLYSNQVEKIRDNFSTLQTEILDQWKAVATKISNDRNNPELYNTIVNAVMNVFPTWEKVDKKFGFTWHKYFDINGIAKVFIEDHTKEVINKMAEMASKIKAKLIEKNLTEHTMKSLKGFTESLKDGMDIFDNPSLSNLVNELNAWTNVSAKDLMDSSKLSEMINQTMDGIISASENHIDEIAKESVNSLLGYHRKINLE